MADKVPLARVEETTLDYGVARSLSCFRCRYDLNALEPFAGLPPPQSPAPMVRCPECGLEQRTDGMPKFGISRWKAFGILVGAWAISCTACAIVPLPVVPAIGSALIGLLVLGRIEVPRGARIGPIATIILLWLATNGLMFGLLLLFGWWLIWSGVGLST